MASGALSAQAKWREVKPTMVEHPTFISLLKFVDDNDPKRTSDQKKAKDDKSKSLPSSSVEGGPRDVFDEVLAALVQAEREDRRLLRRVFEDGLGVDARKRKHKGDDDSDGEEKEDEHAVGIFVHEVQHDSDMLDTKTQLENFVANTAITEDTKIFKYKALIADILTLRLQNFEIIFKGFVAEKIEEVAIKAKKQRKYEDRYLDLLDDYYYRSDHVGLQWDEAKADLCRHSAYLDLSRELRKSLFLTHMQELADELAKKSSSAAAGGSSEGVSSGSGQDSGGQEEGEIDMDDSVTEHVASAATAASGGATKSLQDESTSSRGRSNSRSRSRSRSRSISDKSSKRREHIDDDRDKDRDQDRDQDRRAKHSRSDRHSGDRDSKDGGSSKRKRHHDSSRSEDYSEDDDEDDSGRDRKSKKSKKDKKDKKDKKSHKHSSHKVRH